MSALFLDLARTVLFLSSWVELPATTLAGKHMGTLLPNCVRSRHLQRLESFATDITGVNPLSLLCVVPPH